jgi:putative copper resistance protein D
MADALIVIRFVHFAAAMASFGTAAFHLYAFAGEARPGDAARASFDATLAGATRASAVVAVLSAVAMVPLVAAAMAGSAAAAFAPTVLGEVLVETSFGHAWCLHLAFAILLAALAIAAPRRAGAATVAALLVLASLGTVGHATIGRAAAGLAHQLNQMVHLAAGGIWLGGLLPLGLLLRRAVRSDGAAFAPLARTALPHFSQMGYAAVVLVALTGAINSVMLVGSFRGLVTTAYGRLLLVKLLLVAAMVALALVNRLRLLPRLDAAAADARVPLRALCRSVAFEQMLGLAILAVVAVLGTWPPASMR